MLPHSNSAEDHSRVEFGAPSVVAEVWKTRAAEKLIGCIGNIFPSVVAGVSILARFL
jgi:hypothetical protein